MNGGCVTLADQNQDPNNPLPHMLYAQFHGTPIGTANGSSFGVMMSGSGGSYSGMYSFTQCDAPDTYSADNLVLVSASGAEVAVASATSHGSSSYNVVYAGGVTTMATGFKSNTVSYAAMGSMPTFKVLSVNPLTSTARQGDTISVQVSLMDQASCGIQQSQWWLTAAATPPGTLPAQDIAAVTGSMGTAAVHVGPNLAPGGYYIEGQVTLGNGRVMRIQRNSTADASYKIFEASSNMLAGDVGASAMAITISANPAADRTPPVAWETSAVPAAADRCGTINLSLVLTDDHALPPSQQVRMILGTASNPRLTSALITGGNVLSGTFVVPSDAPYGIWYGYPDTVVDAAGNQASGMLTGGSFTLSGSTMPVMAATFIVPDQAALVVPDLAASTVDGGVPLPDLAASPFPATLATLSVSAAMPPSKPGDTATVQMTWNDLANIL
jgi:hypothetical protein